MNENDNFDNKLPLLLRNVKVEINSKSGEENGLNYKVV